MLTLIVLVVLVVVVPLAVLILWSPGRMIPYRDQNGDILPGSLAEKVFVTIQGNRQGMIIRSKNVENPVLLFLHGGPGMPEYAISRQYPEVLENYFTVCWWDQRGAGLSYDAKMPMESMTFDHMIQDTLEVTHYLRNRFHQDKIYLMAHSGGSFIGIQVVEKHPELYHAYLGMSQITYQSASEKIAYQYMLDHYAQTGNEKMLKTFKKFPISNINTFEYYQMRDKPMHELGIGTTHQMRSVISGVFWPVMKHSELSWREKVNIWRGKAFITKKVGLWNQLVEVDLRQKIHKLQLPVYFFGGIYDYTTSYKLAKEYLFILEAPMKGFYTFDHSAHSPLFEEPERMKEILEKDVLKGIVSLADAENKD